MTEAEWLTDRRRLDMFSLSRPFLAALYLAIACTALGAKVDQGAGNVSIEGNWKATSIVFWGEKWPPAKTDLMTIRIRRETLEFAGRPDENGESYAKGMRYTIRQEANGMLIDLQFIDSRYEGFCRFDEDGRLGICWASKGRPRPLGFAEKPEDKRTLLVLERIKQE